MRILRYIMIFLTASCVVSGVVRIEANQVNGVIFEFEDRVGEEPLVNCRFPTMRGLRYELLGSADMNVWEPLGATIIGDGTTQILQASAAGNARYYKVSAALNDTLVSAITGIEYPIHVYVPNEYLASSSDYPIIYATDGQWQTDGFSSAIESRNKQVILITIEQGPGDRRAIDYRLPGGLDYYDFLTTELIPAVESIYRIDPNQRVLCGTSLGGLLVGTVLLIDDVTNPYFKTYLSFDGSFWLDSAEFANLEQNRYDLSQSMNVTLYLTSATVGPNNDFWVTSFQNRMEGRNFQGLTIYRRSHSVTHNNVAQPSFEDALDDLF